MRVKGFSTIEILLAGAIFVVFAWGVMEVLLQGMMLDRKAEETTQATWYAAEGIAAVRAMSADDFTSLREGSTGLDRVQEQWVLSGTSDALGGKYERVITLVLARRDGNGVLVEDGSGTEDADGFRVQSTVTWALSPSQNDAVVLETYVTHFR